MKNDHQFCAKPLPMSFELVTLCLSESREGITNSITSLHKLILTHACEADPLWNR